MNGNKTRGERQRPRLDSPDADYSKLVVRYSTYNTYLRRTDPEYVTFEVLRVVIRRTQLMINLVVVSSAPRIAG